MDAKEIAELRASVEKQSRDYYRMTVAPAPQPLAIPQQATITVSNEPTIMLRASEAKRLIEAAEESHRLRDENAKLRRAFSRWGEEPDDALTQTPSP